MTYTIATIADMLPLVEGLSDDELKRHDEQVYQDREALNRECRKWNGRKSRFEFIGTHHQVEMDKALTKLAITISHEKGRRSGTQNISTKGEW